ncbi:MAG TPA: PAS domain-containing protein [Spirochaetia bacterium]|nr:PAS domain-containing protein [Spirochaetia bacterium]
MGSAAPLFFLPGFFLTPDIAVRFMLCVGVLVAGFVVVVREQASRSAVAFFLLTLTVGIWIGGSALVFAAADPALALAVTRHFTHVGTSFIPSMMLGFVLERIGYYRRYRRAMLASYGFSLLCAAMFSLTDRFIPSVRLYWWGYVPQFSVLAVSFLVFFFGLFILSGVLLVRVHLQALTKTHGKRMLLFVLGLSISSLAAVDFLPAYGVPVYSFGAYAILGLIASAVWVATRYRFTEITPANMGEEIMETMTEGFLVFDLQGNIRLANEAASKILDTPVAALSGHAAATIPGLEGLTSHFPGVIEHGTETFDTVLLENGGIVVRFSASAIYGRTSEPTAIVCRVHDLTENVRNKAALRYEQNLLRTLIQNLPVSVYVKDTECRKVLANPVDMSWMMEFKPDGDVIGKTDLEVFPRDVAERFFTDDQAVIHTGKPVMDREEFYRDSNGTEKWLLTSKIPLFDEAGAVAGLVGTGRDITERKRAEEALKASLKEKDLLLKEVHHRVKNNLQIVCSLINLERHREEGSSATSRALRDVESRVRSMALVHEVLYESGNFALIKFSSYLEKLCQTLLVAYATDHDQIQLKVCVEEASLALVKAIPCGLIVNELVVNSLKHAFPEGRRGTITIEMSKGEEGVVSLAVRDDGIGISESLEELRQKKTLGLSIVESLVRQLSGTLDVQSHGGLTVRVVFPG